MFCLSMFQLAKCLLYISKPAHSSFVKLQDVAEKKLSLVHFVYFFHISDYVLTYPKKLNILHAFLQIHVVYNGDLTIS